MRRFCDGNYGDFKNTGNKLSEARLFFGPGYRIYFSIRNNKLVLLLMDGDKSTQTEDIETARKILEEYCDDHKNYSL